MRNGHAFIAYAEENQPTMKINLNVMFNMLMYLNIINDLLLAFSPITLKDY